MLLLLLFCVIVAAIIAAKVLTSRTFWRVLIGLVLAGMLYQALGDATEIVVAMLLVGGAALVIYKAVKAEQKRQLATEN